MNLLSIIFCFGLFVPSSEPALLEKQEEAQLILDELFEVVGNKNLEKPELMITQGEEAVASYSPYLNAIILEEKAFDACAELGDKRKDALAFIIGHELGHGFQSAVEDHQHETNFLSYDKCNHSKKDDEENADLFGCFTSYLAGYKIDEVVSKTLTSVYKNYNLMDKVLTNYPTLDERMKSSKLIMKKVEDLVLLYELAPTLDIAGHYSASKSCYQHITQFYQGREIYNNLGISYLLEALNISDTNIDKYAFPFEIDKDSRLKRPFGDNGGKSLDYQEQILREVLISKAINQFDLAIKLDPEYEIAYSNRILALSLLGESKKLFTSIEEISNNHLFKNSSLLNLAIAISFLNSGTEDQIQKGRNTLRELMNDKSDRISSYAALNLSISLDESFDYLSSCDCSENKFPSTMPLLYKMNAEKKLINVNDGMSISSIVNKKSNEYNIEKIIKLETNDKVIYIGQTSNKENSLCSQIQTTSCNVGETQKLIIDPMENHVTYMEDK